MDDIVGILDQARAAAARTVNTIMTATYWHIGRRIVEEDQHGQRRAEYGDALIRRLSADLTSRFGRGFSPRTLRQIRRFYLTWPPEQIWHTASAKSPTLPTSHDEEAGAARPVDAATLAETFPLAWSAYARLMSVKDAAARRFYETEALRSGWTVRQLNRQIESMYYERTALSRNKAAMLTKSADRKPGDHVTPVEAIRDPFVLEFLGLKDEYSETDLEDALITHLAEFLLELGDDFTFVGRQRRMRIGDSWHRVDLVLFHRSLRCLLLIELKTGAFSYEAAGQIHMYLNYARENWTKPGENPPVGLILSAEKDAEQARYALDGLPNPVLAAEYKVTLPEPGVIEAELARTRRELEARASAAGP
ncbi:MAG: PDDEXK nuclease domain-containing protein [Bifidobacteriaceae bacterium]|nr:PDDEXK nuclease domain-containing protein [Bifidobacteriaceae bacterium]